MFRSPAPCWALLSVLGVPGWGPVHLLLKQGADPAQIAGRLRQSLGHAGLPVSGCEVPAGRLLAALLRSQADLDPVAALEDGVMFVCLRFRHRLVCREAGLIIRSWERRNSRCHSRRSSDGDSDGDSDGRGHRRGDWCSLGPGQRLEDFLRSPRRGAEDWSPAATARRPGNCIEPEPTG
ncbi:MAG: hypothetical protein WAM11_14205 [Cyanobium sp.]